MSPHAGIAVRLQFQSDRQRVRRGWIGPLGLAHLRFRPRQRLDVVSEFVREYIRLRKISGGAEAALQLVEETEIQVHLVIAGTIEGTSGGLGKAARRLNLVPEQGHL